MKQPELMLQGAEEDNKTTAIQATAGRHRQERNSLRPEARLPVAVVLSIPSEIEEGHKKDEGRGLSLTSGRPHSRQSLAEPAVTVVAKVSI